MGAMECTGGWPSLPHRLCVKQFNLLKCRCPCRALRPAGIPASSFQAALAQFPVELGRDPLGSGALPAKAGFAQSPCLRLVNYTEHHCQAAGAKRGRAKLGLTRAWCQLQRRSTPWQRSWTCPKPVKEVSSLLVWDRRWLQRFENIAGMAAQPRFVDLSRPGFCHRQLWNAGLVAKSSCLRKHVLQHVPKSQLTPNQPFLVSTERRLNSGNMAPTDATNRGGHTHAKECTSFVLLVELKVTEE